MHEVKLNLGCGRNVLAGWVNIDNSPSVLLSRWPLLKRLLFRVGLIEKTTCGSKWPNDIVWRDVTKGLPYPDGTVDKIYSSHMLEHLERERGEFLLRECFRVLKRRGLLRLVVPDLMFHARRYLQRVSESDLVGREPHDEFLWNIYGAYLKKRRHGASHHYMYDWPTLRLVLQEIGFSPVIRQSYQVSLDPELSLLDNRPEDSLHVDAVK